MGNDLKGMTLEELSSLAVSLGQPSYRGRQIFSWLYNQGVSTLDEMTNLGHGFRDCLGAGGYYVGALKVISRRVSRIDGTQKYLFQLGDGNTIESVLIPDDGRYTVCFSTQVGCGMRCSFCATGQSGLIRNLTAGEIIDQVLQINRISGFRATNAVAMGQGEPLANYDQCLKALRLLNAPEGLNMGARRLTLSTCGIVPGILALAGEPEQFGLAVSLHSARDRQRDILMPVNRRFPLSEVRTACLHYAERSGRRVTLEYALIQQVNDTERDLEALVEFCRGWLCHVNLIPLNPVQGVPWQRSLPENVRQFARRLEAAGVAVSVRKERGADLEAACGQLRQRQVTPDGSVLHD